MITYFETQIFIHEITESSILLSEFNYFFTFGLPILVVIDSEKKHKHLPAQSLENLGILYYMTLPEAHNDI